MRLLIPTLLSCSLAALLVACQAAPPDASTHAEAGDAAARDSTEGATPTTSDAPAATTTPADAASAQSIPTDASAAKGGRAAGEEDVPVGIWRAFGTEPFWNVNAEGGRLVFTTPEDQAGKVLQGRRIPSLIGTVMTGTDGDKAFQLGITPGQCSDGMSDNEYPYKATFSYGEASYTGCAEQAKAK